MSGHTPGPWKVVGDAIHGADADEVCEVNWSTAGVNYELVEPRSIANASLIAAAPDLLAACKALIETPTVDGNSDDPELTAAFNAARTAIAKAEGRTP